MRPAIVYLVLLAGCPGGGAKKSATGGGGNPDLRQGSDGEGPGTGSGSNPTGSTGPGGGDNQEPEDAKKIDEPTVVSGAIDPSVVRHVVKTNQSELRLCYEQALMTAPGISGRVVVTFTIEIDGHTVDVTAAGIDPAVENCMAAKFRGFKFPRPDGKVTVSYPFVFKP